jgi:hypothetical protein
MALALGDDVVDNTIIKFNGYLEMCGCPTNISSVGFVAR